MNSTRKFGLLHKMLSMVIVFSLTFTPQGFTLPETGDVDTTGGTYTKDGDVGTYNQDAAKAIAESANFNVWQNETFNINQPGAGSILMWRVNGGNISQILGSVKANGQFWLLNPYGVVFGANCSINAAGFMASTLNTTNESFLDGSYVFSKVPGKSGYIINKGSIAALDGGYVAMLTEAMRNEGVIQAKLGTVVLAAGEKMTVELDSAGSISVAIEEGVSGTVTDADGNIFEDAILNAGEITADGGTVILTANVLNDIFQKAVNNEGLIKANSLVEKNGEVYLMAGGGDQAMASNTGTIIAGATGPGLDGGFVEISGPRVLVDGVIDVTAADGAHGSLLIDPWDLYIIRYDNNVDTSDGWLPWWELGGGTGVVSELWLESFNGNLTLEAMNDVHFQLGEFWDGGSWVDVPEWDDMLNMFGTAIDPTLYTFKINAGRDINLNNDSIMTNGGNMSLNADVGFAGGPPADGVGNVNLGSGMSLHSGGGDIELTGVDVMVTTLVRSEGGKVDIRAKRDIVHSSNGDVATEGGNFDADAKRDYHLKNGATVVTGDGDIDIHAGRDILLGFPGQGFADSFDWSYVGGDRGYNLREIGYYYYDANNNLVEVSFATGADISSGSGSVGPIADMAGYYVKFDDGAAYSETFYTDPSLNVDMLDHLYMDSNGGLFFSWEDNSLPDSDWDFNDLIMGVTTAPGTEPHVGAFLVTNNEADLDACRGNILQASGMIYADDLYMDAGKNIGATAANKTDYIINTSVNDIWAKANDGDVYIDEVNGVNLNNIQALGSTIDIITGHEVDSEDTNVTYMYAEGGTGDPAEILLDVLHANLNVDGTVKAVAAGRNGAAALVKLNVADGDLDVNKSKIKAEADSFTSADAKVKLTAEKGSIKVKNSTVKADAFAYYDSVAKVNMDAYGDIIIKDSPDSIIANAITYDAPAVAAVNMDSENGDIEVVNSKVKATAFGEESSADAKVDIDAQNGDIKVKKSTIKAESEARYKSDAKVNLYANQDITVEDSPDTIIADAYTHDYKADAKVNMDAQYGSIKVKNSTVKANAEVNGMWKADAKVNLSAHGDIVVNDSPDTIVAKAKSYGEADAKVNMSSYDGNIKVKNSTIKADASAGDDNIANAKINMYAYGDIDIEDAPDTVLAKADGSLSAYAKVNMTSEQGNIKVINSTVKAVSVADYVSEAIVNMLACFDILVKDATETIEANAYSEKLAAIAKVDMDAQHGNIKVKNSTVKADAWSHGSDAEAKVNMYAQYDIDIVDAPDTVSANVYGYDGADAKVNMTSELGNIKVKNSKIKADANSATKIGEAKVEMDANSDIDIVDAAVSAKAFGSVRADAKVNMDSSYGSIRVKNSTVKADANAYADSKAKVNMEAYYGITIEDSPDSIIAEAYSHASPAVAAVTMHNVYNNIEVINSKVKATAGSYESSAEAKVNMTAMDADILVKNSTVKAESDAFTNSEAKVDMYALQNITVVDSPDTIIADAYSADTTAKAIINMDSLIGGIEIKNSTVKANAETGGSYKAEAKVNMSALNDIVVADSPDTIIAKAYSHDDADAKVNMSSYNGNIKVKNSTVKADAYGDDKANAKINMYAYGDIDIVDAPDTVSAKAEGSQSADAKVNMTSEFGDIKVKNSKVKAESDSMDFSEAMINMDAQDGNIKIINSTVKAVSVADYVSEAIVKMLAYYDILVKDASETVEANASSKNSAAKAKVDMDAQNGDIKVKNSTVKALATGDNGTGAKVDMKAGKDIIVRKSIVKAFSDNGPAEVIMMACRNIKIKASGICAQGTKSAKVAMKAGRNIFVKCSLIGARARRKAVVLLRACRDIKVVKSIIKSDSLKYALTALYAGRDILINNSTISADPEDLPTEAHAQVDIYAKRNIDIINSEIIAQVGGGQQTAVVNMYSGNTYNLIGTTISALNYAGAAWISILSDNNIILNNTTVKAISFGGQASVLLDALGNIGIFNGSVVKAIAHTGSAYVWLNAYGLVPGSVFNGDLYRGVIKIADSLVKAVSIESQSGSTAVVEMNAGMRDTKPAPRPEMGSCDLPCCQKQEPKGDAVAQLHHSGDSHYGNIIIDNSNVEATAKQTDAIIDLDAAGNIVVHNGSNVLANAENASAYIEMDADGSAPASWIDGKRHKGDVYVVNSTVSADVQGDDDSVTEEEAKVEINAFDDIVIKDAPHTISAYLYGLGKAIVNLFAGDDIKVVNSSVTAKVMSDHYDVLGDEVAAQVLMDAGDDVDITNSTVEAEIKLSSDNDGFGSYGGIFEAEVDIQAGGDVKVADSEIEAEVEINDEDSIWLENTEVKAELEIDAGGDVDIDNSEVEAEVEIDAVCGDVEINDGSLIDSRVDVNAGEKIRIHGSEVSAATEIDGGDVTIKHSHVESEVELDLENCDVIEIYGSNVNALVDIDAGDKLGIFGSAVHAEVDVDADRGDVEIYRSGIDARVKLEAGYSVRLHGDDIKAEVEIDGNDVDVKFSKIEAETELTIPRYGIAGGILRFIRWLCGDAPAGIEIFGGSIQALVDIDANDKLGIFGSAVHAEVDVNAGKDDIFIKNNNIDARVKLGAGYSIRLHGDDIKADVEIEADDIKVKNSKIESEVEITIPRYGLGGGILRLIRWICGDDPAGIEIFGTSIQSKVDVDAENDLGIFGSKVHAEVDVDAGKDDISVKKSGIDSRVKLEADDKLRLHGDDIKAEIKVEGDDIYVKDSKIESEVELLLEDCDVIEIFGTDVKAEVDIDSEDDLEIFGSKVHAEVKVDSDDEDIEIRNSKIEANVKLEADEKLRLHGDDIKAEIKIKGDDIYVKDSKIESEVEIEIEEREQKRGRGRRPSRNDSIIEIFGTDVKAEVDVDSEDDLEIFGSDVHAEIKVDADKGDIEIRNSKIDARVKLEADEKLRLHGDNIKAEIKIKGDDIYVKDSKIESEVEIEIEEREQKRGRGRRPSRNDSIIEIFGTDVKAEVDIAADDNAEIFGSAVHSEIDIDADKGDVEIRNGEFDARVEVKAEDKVRLHGDDIKAEIEVDGDDIYVKDSKVEAEVELKLEDCDVIEIYGSSVKANVDIEADDAEIFGSAVHAEVDVDADNGDVEIKNSAIDARVEIKAEDKIRLHGDDVKAEIKIKGDDVKIKQSYIESEVDLSLEDCDVIEIYGSSVKANVDLESDDELGIFGSSVHAEVDIDADKGDVDIRNSAIDARVDARSDYNIRIHGSDVKADVKLKGSDVTIKDSHVESEIELTIAEYGWKGAILRGLRWLFGGPSAGIEIFGSSVKAGVEIDAKDETGIFGSSVHAEVDVDSGCDDVDIRTSAIDARVDVESDYNIRIHGSDIKAEIEMDGNDVTIKDSHVESEIELDVPEFGFGGAILRGLRWLFGGPSAGVEIFGSSVEAEVDVDAKDDTGIFGSAVHAEVDIDAGFDNVEINYESEIEAEVKLEAGNKLRLHGDDIKAESEIKGKNVTVTNSEIEAEVESKLEDCDVIEIFGTIVKAKVEIDAKKDIKINGSEVAAVVEVDAGRGEVDVRNSDIEAEVDMDAKCDDIEITNSTVKAFADGPLFSKAKVNLNAGDDITITDAPETVTAHVFGNGIASVEMNAGDDIDVLGSVVSSVVTGNGVAKIGMYAGDDITIDIDSIVKSIVVDSGFAGVMAVACGNIFADGPIRALVNGECGFAGIGLLAKYDVFARDVIASAPSNIIEAIEYLLPYCVGMPIDIGAQYGYGSSVLLGSLRGNVYLGDITADMVLAIALGWEEGPWGGNIYNYPDDTIDTVHAHYLDMIARYNIGTSDSPIKMDVDIVSAFSYDIGDVFLQQMTDRLVQLGLYLPILGYLPVEVPETEDPYDGPSEQLLLQELEMEWQQVAALGKSVAANNGIIHVTSAGDMVVNSVVSPRGGVYLEATGVEVGTVVDGEFVFADGYYPTGDELVRDGVIYQGASIYAGTGWCPVPGEGWAAIEEYLGESCLFDILFDIGTMDVMDTQWSQGSDYMTPWVFGMPDLHPGPNVVAGGYSFFAAPNGTIGVGYPEGAPGVSGDLEDPLNEGYPYYNPLDVCIQVLEENLVSDANPFGLNSVFPSGPGELLEGIAPVTGLSILMGDAFPSTYQDVWPGGGTHGPLGISGAITGIVRPGQPVNFYTESVTPQVIPVEGTGYVFYRDTDDVCCPPFEGYPDAVNPSEDGYDMRLQIWPIIPGLAVPAFLPNINLIADELRFRIPRKNIVDSFQVTHTQGPISLVNNMSAFFYHPLVEMEMYEVTPLGEDVYEFIDGNINPTNPALLPLALGEEEEEELQV